MLVGIKRFIDRSFSLNQGKIRQRKEKDGPGMYIQ